MEDDQETIDAIVDITNAAIETSEINKREIKDIIADFIYHFQTKQQHPEANFIGPSRNTIADLVNVTGLIRKTINSLSKLTNSDTILLSKQELYKNSEETAEKFIVIHQEITKEKEPEFSPK